jgi:hypothetical protein
LAGEGSWEVGRIVSRGKLISELGFRIDFPLVKVDI